MADKIKILILEDNKSDVELLQYELKKSGLDFFSEIVQTSKDFVKALDRFKPDIILSDFSLPSFDGISAFHIKQKKYPEIPFIIVSGTIGDENAVELIKSGITDYSLKDKLFSLNHKIHRALKDAQEKKAKTTSDELLKSQYKKLKEIAILQSHQVRGPVASILGLINLFNFTNPNDPINLEVMKKLQKTTLLFDTVIHDIVQKTNEIHSVN